ncbi:MAG: ADP-ribosylation factor family protein [Candidatus Hodarchaeota archaeon]
MGFFKNLMKKKVKTVNIAIIGLDNAGKSTTLNFLVEGEPTETIPTVGVNYEKLSLGKNIVLNMIDLGGQKAFRKFWKGPIHESQCMIFVIDSTDKERFIEARDELHGALDEFPRDFPVLVLANKQDLVTAADKSELIQIMGLDLLDGRDWHIENTSAIEGTGLSEAFHWLYEHITGEKVKRPFVPKDIIIFEKTGIPVVSKSQIFKESGLAAGFLSAINSFVSHVAEERLNSITMGKHKVVFHYLNELMGAIIVDSVDNEKAASDMLKSILGLISESGIENAEKVLTNFVINEIKGSA